MSCDDENRDENTRRLMELSERNTQAAEDNAKYSLSIALSLQSIAESLRVIAGDQPKIDG